VNVKVENGPKLTVGNPVSLGCEINLPKGLIISDINIEWKTNDRILQRDKCTVNYINLHAYTYYNYSYVDTYSCYFYAKQV